MHGHPKSSRNRTHPHNIADGKYRQILQFVYISVYDYKSTNNSTTNMIHEN